MEKVTPNRNVDKNKLFFKINNYKLKLKIIIF